MMHPQVEATKEARVALREELARWWDSGPDLTSGEWVITAHPVAIEMTDTVWSRDRGGYRETDYGRFVLRGDESLPVGEFRIERRRYHVEGVL